MSVFDEILSKINEISNSYVNSLNNELQARFDALDKFEEEYKNARGKRETTQRNKNLMNTLQSINEDEDEPQKEVTKSAEVAGEKKRLSNKRSKQEVEGLVSPEQEKRQKRNASVRAQNNITKQNLHALKILNQNIILLSEDEDEVNVNLTQKLRRDDSTEKSTRRRKDVDKENTEPVPIVQIKLEKISIPPEPMELEAALDIEVKTESNKDDFSMPPPAAVPKVRKVVQKEKSTDSEEEQTGKRRTRTRKQTDTVPPPAGADERSARASRRATKQPDEPPPPEPRPKRTRAKKKVSESSAPEENAPLENGMGSPAEKPRPKRTRRAQKAAEKEEKAKELAVQPEIIPKEEPVSEHKSPAIPQKTAKKTKNTDTTEISDISTEPKKDPKSKAAKSKEQERLEERTTQVIIEPKGDEVKSKMQEDEVICPLNATVTISMDKTVVLTNGVLDGKNANIMNETHVIDKLNRETMILDKPLTVMNATVVLDKALPQKDGTPNITDDMSLLTDDSDHPVCSTPPPSQPPQPASAVKAKVQQFEEMAARTTRTKTRAMAKKDAESENCTPPDKITKQVLSMDTLTKMNNMIFNGKTAQISVSASKPTAKPPPTKTMPASASKVSAISKAREEYECSKDDARRKKEAMLEAKREQQRRKREEKMAAAAAARELADKERRAAMQAAAKERMEKQAHADQGKLVRQKEVEKKKQELARKVAETEERRRAEEQARHARLAEEQKRADAARKKQLEENEAMKKEAALMAKEIEKRQKEYLEKQKMKQKMEADKFHTPLKSKGTPCGKPPPMEPVYMADGFQYLYSDEDSEDDAPRHRPKIPTPGWAMQKALRHALSLQQRLPPLLVDRLFSVRTHSPDLRAIFPAVERRALTRTSSAVWRTPPANLSAVRESPI